MDAETLRRFDRSRMYEAYDDWPQMAKEHYRPDADGADFGDISHVVFAGMGGSGTISDIFSAILSKTGIHTEVVKGYQLPRTAGPESLVVATSISGNTEETLDVLRDSVDRGCRVAAFSDGGRLEKACRKRSLFHHGISSRHSPRASLPAFLYAMLGTLGPFLPVRNRDIDESLAVLEGIGAEILSSNADGKNPAASLAGWMTEVPLIYYPRGLQAAAVRFKNSLQENAKMHAAAEDVIEACHNGIVPWVRPSRFQPVLIRGADDHWKTRERWSILAEFFKEREICFREIHSTGGGILGKLVGLIYLLDYATVYKAAASGIDPTPILPIDFVKAKLADAAR